MTDEIAQLELASSRPADGYIVTLRTHFPEVFVEDTIDFDALKRSLGEWVDSGPERFGLTWPGKAECKRVIQEPSVGTLVPMLEESVDWDATQNVIIEGENLEVLKLLQKAYYRQIKLIYIDPPYNTGKEFVYPDNFKEGLADYLRYSGQTNEEGFKLATNTDNDGRYHSKWLSMMYPRLFLSRNLLSDHGFLLVSIGDHEVHNLRSMLNEIYGEENFVATMVWQGGRLNDSKLVSSGHDYILVFAKNLALLTAEDLHWEERKQGLHAIYTAAEKIRLQVGEDFDEVHRRLLRWFRELPDGNPSKDHSQYSFMDERGIFHKDNITSPNYRENLVYDFLGYIPPTNGWRYERSTMNRLHNEGRLHLPEDTSQRITVKRYLHETETWAPNSVFYKDRRGARKVVENLLGVSAKGLFDFPKDHSVLARLIETITEDDDLIFDFFAGSGSTAHAVMEANARDGANRRFALVQLPEPVDSEQFPNIAEITRARVKAAGEAIAARPPTLQEAPRPDTGFRSFRLSTSNFAVWNSDITSEAQLAEQLEFSVEHMAAGSGDGSILAELVLKSGFPLASAISEIELAGIDGYSIADGDLLICLSSDLTIESIEAMVELEPATILLLDSGFANNDELKVNALQTVRSRNQQRGSDIALRVV